MHVVPMVWLRQALRRRSYASTRGVVCHTQVWDWAKRELKQKLDLGPKGLIPLEVRL
jgi:hypothetical protein